jgi:hypothetical protein
MVHFGHGKKREFEKSQCNKKKSIALMMSVGSRCAPAEAQKKTTPSL